MAKKRHSREQQEHQQAQAPESEWSSQSASAFFGEHKKLFMGLGIALLILIPLLFSIAFRSSTFSLPITNEWAKSSVDGAVRSSIAAQVAKEFPNLPPPDQKTLVDQQYTDYLSKNGAALQPQIDQTAAYFRSQLQDDNGHTYLPDLDTYNTLLRTEQILKNGFPGDVMKDGQIWNTHMLAPLGVQTAPDFYSWFVANTYRVAHVFVPTTTPVYVFFWIPVFFAALCVVPAFFLGRREGLFAGFFAAMLVAVHPAFIQQSAAGYASTHVLQLFFPIMVAWFFLEAFEAATWLKRLVYLGLTGLTFGIFALAWGYWWFLFDVFLLVVIAYVVYQALQHLIRGKPVSGLAKNHEVTWSLVMLGGFIVSTALFITLFVGFSQVFNGPMSVFATTADFKAAAQAGSIWPNVMTTVAELNEPGIAQIISSAGGKFLFLLAMMGMLFTLVPKDKLKLRDWGLLGFGLLVFLYLISAAGTSLPILWFLVVMSLPVLLGGIVLLWDERDIDMKYAIFLVAWLAASIFIMTKGVRFILLVLPPFILGVAISIGAIYALLRTWLTTGLGFSKRWAAVLLIVILCTPLIPITVEGYASGQQTIPLITRAWVDSLTLIKEKSAPDAIINSWWDFGHWFKQVADRRVTFDGASQRGQLANWIGKALLTSDERETLAILRMVDCGSDQGSAEIQAAIAGHDEYEAVMITKKVIMLPLADARALLLSHGISAQQAEVILAHTHCAPPEDYFITSSDMIGKAGVWGHFGSWDFARADAYALFRTKPQAEAVPAMVAKYGWTQQEASDIYFKMQTFTDQAAVNAWISSWPGYITGSWSSCAASPVDKTVLLCQVNVRLGDQNGATTVLEGLVYNVTQPNQSFLAVGFYDAQGRKLGANNDVKPSMLLLAQNGTTQRVNFTGNLFGQGFIVDVENDRVLLVDPLHAESMFAKLYFLDGKGTVGFEKFSDKSDFMGNRIIVWKVDWSKLAPLGLA